MVQELPESTLTRFSDVVYVYTLLLPPELGRLASLVKLDLHGNQDMAGPLPASMAQLMRLRTLYIDGTALCVPSEPAFSTWLAMVGDFRGERCSG